MKQFTIVFPKDKAHAFASYAYSKEIRIMLSWLQEDFFSLSSAGGVHSICISSEAVATELMSSEWKQFIKN